MVSVGTLMDILLNGLTIGMVYVLVAAGLSIVFGLMDVLNISHGELLALGAYFAYSITVGVGEGDFWLALVVAPLLIGLIGIALERTTIRRVYGRGHLAHILLTFGLLLIIYDLKKIVWGKEAKLFSPPAALDSTVQILGYSYSVYNYFMIASGALLALLTWALLNYTRFGLVIRAGSQDRRMVRNLGIDIDRYYMLVFGFGAALAAFGGVVLGGYQNVNLHMGNSVIIPAFVIVVLGGLGSFRGAVIGGIIVGFVQSVASYYIPQVQGMVIFLLMVGVLLYRPQGLFGGDPASVTSERSEPSEFVSGLEGGVLSDRGQTWLGIATVAALALVPVFDGIFYSKFIVTLFITILIWALFAMSLDVILGYSGLVSLGQTMFYGLGAYVTILVLMHASPSVPVALLVTLVFSAAIAWIVGYLSIRVSGVYFVMITLAFAEIVYQIVQELGFTGATNGLFGAPEPLYGVGGVGFRLDEVSIGIEPVAFSGDELFYYVLLGVVILSYVFTRRVMRAPFGTVLQAVRENELRSEFVGYEVKSFKRQAFVLSSTLAGLAGAMFALYYGYAAPSQLNWVNSGDVIVMAVLGGSGTLYGPMMGASVFIVFEQMVSSLFPWWRLLLGIVFVLVVLFLPKGLVSLPSSISDLVERTADEVSFDDEEPEVEQ